MNENERAIRLEVTKRRIERNPGGSHRRGARKTGVERGTKRLRDKKPRREQKSPASSQSKMTRKPRL